MRYPNLSYLSIKINVLIGAGFLNPPYQMTLFDSKQILDFAKKKKKILRALDTQIRTTQKTKKEKKKKH